MKKGRRISFGIGVCMLLLSTSCNKVLDRVAARQDDLQDNHQDSRIATRSAAQKYRIKSIYGRRGNDSTTAYFEYNTAGNPVSIRFTETATGRLNAFFRYNTQDQLRD